MVTINISVCPGKDCMEMNGNVVYGVENALNKDKKKPTLWLNAIY